MTTVIEEIIEQANTVWIPKWFSLFCDPNGGFYERIDLNATPLDHPRRVLSQCRQLIVFSRAYHEGAFSDHEILKKSFDYIVTQYQIPDTGGFKFSLMDDHYDLYAHAFVILMCAEYYAASKDIRALDMADCVHEFIQGNFVHKNGLGFYEGLGPDLSPVEKIRRQNPHMHLFEAVLAMYEITGKAHWKNAADHLLRLFKNYFFDSGCGVLREFFQADLTPHYQDGDIVEAGHHSEWIWLLTRYQALIGDQEIFVQNVIPRLFDFVATHGIDGVNGGIYNFQRPDGAVVDSQKRIWPVMESLRAASILRQSHHQQAAKVYNDMLICFERHYMDIKTGLWHEILDQNMCVTSDYRPATTPYHIYLALLDSKSYLE